jgi:hypothetical protein
MVFFPWRGSVMIKLSLIGKTVRASLGYLFYTKSYESRNYSSVFDPADLIYLSPWLNFDKCPILGERNRIRLARFEDFSIVF